MRQQVHSEDQMVCDVFRRTLQQIKTWNCVCRSGNSSSVWQVESELSEGKQREFTHESSGT